MFFDSWMELLRVAVVGALSYGALVLFLRLSGKRTLAKMNAFDLVVTVALGSTLATIVLSTDVALAEGILAFATLIGLQYAVAWGSNRVPALARLVKSEPRLLFHDGRFLEGALRAERVTRDEVLAAIRQSGTSSIDEVRSVILETSGEFSVLGPPGPRDSSLLDSVDTSESGGTPAP